ncbi:hypothetical protein WJX73_010487 [Symbiochloris irregularis]|uniref:Major facilitator superfamily (MFS) profile domain-containing protein n=1 Tax=Symbiochloris irregularis TaxID=706552 RepID=A0AAW1NTR9_9CHLO
MAQTAYSLTAAKWWYGITFSASAVVYPFLTIYFKLCGFSDSQVGFLFAVRPWLTAIMGNLWAGLADHLQIHWPLFIACYIVSSLVRFSISLTSSFPVALAVCVLTELFSPPVMILMDAATMAASAEVNQAYGRTRVWGAVGWGAVSPIGGWLVTNYGMRDGFYGYLILVIVGLIPSLLAPIQVLTDRCKEAKLAREAWQSASEPPPASLAAAAAVSEAACHLKSAPPDLVKASLGDGQQHIRIALPAEEADSDGDSVYESVAGTSPVMSAVSEYVAAESVLDGFTSDDSVPADSKPGKQWWRRILLNALEQLPLTCEPVLQAYNPHALQSSGAQTPARPQSAGTTEPDLPTEPAILYGDDAAVHSMSAVERVWAVVSRGEVAVFLVMAVMFGYGMGTIDSFMFIYLRELGGTEFLMGLCIATMCAAEAPVFHFAGPIFDTLGLPLTLHLVMFVYVLRLCLYGILSVFGTPWAVLPIELLHGVTFGCAWSAGTLNCSRIAPKGLEATTQALFNGLYMGVGLGLGAVVGGFIYDATNARIVFFAAAAVVATGWLLLGNESVL